MIKHIWSVLCRESIINQENNNLSLHEVLEALQVGLKPATEEAKGQKPEAVIPINFEITSMFVKENMEKGEKAELETAFYNPKGEMINKDVKGIEMPSGMKRIRTRMKASGLRVQDSGDYIFRVAIKEEGQKLFKVVAELPLEVNIKIEE